jgi:molybdate transport system substrate-binding protein
MLQRFTPVGLALLVFVVVGCTAAGPAEGTLSTPTASPAVSVSTSSAAADDLTGDVVVFAASSLTDAFKDIATEFQHAHPHARAVFSFGGSSQLAIQLVNGARADVFASADQDQMDVAKKGHALLEQQQVFIRNRLMVIAPQDNPASITSLQDLARPGVKVVGAQASVPIGAYTAQLLKSASANANFGADFEQRVERNVVSREDTVRQIVAKIQLGEADAAVVYVTDVTPQIANQFVRVSLPEDLQVTAQYPIAVGNGHNRAGGEAFVAFVQSPVGQHILANWGFINININITES